MLAAASLIGLALLAQAPKAAQPPKPASPSQPLAARVGDVDLQLAAGTIVGFQTGGRQWLTPPSPSTDGLGALVRHGAPDLPLARGSLTHDGKTAVATFPAKAGAAQGSMTLRLTPGDAGEVVVDGKGSCPGAHLESLRWAVACLPKSWTILVPGNSGIALGPDGPADWGGQWPLSWEVQCVIAQGPGRGLCIWAADTRNRFKSLVIHRRSDGWQILLTADNFAPWAEKTTCDLGRWHVMTYQGDWRVPARRYLDWARRNRGLTPVADHGPAWVKDIQCVCICPPDKTWADALAAHINPHRTLLYIPDWRRDGYDHGYPDYTAIPGFAGFVDYAHKLGFHVMAHVNYFGCDPKNPEFARFEKYQVVNPNTGQKEWWVYPFPPEKPVTKFAYINPAVAAWRALLVDRLKQVVARYHVDAFHLDQTLCMYNDANGLYDGMSMIDGNLALHHALREALPQIALSGEGLDEVTCRYECFAQRHAYGLDFIHGTWNRAQLSMANPISSYFLLPETKIYGYLGMASPTSGQIYAAWQENYRAWGVLPTLSRVSPKDLAGDSGWVRFAVDEAAWFCREQPRPDLDTPDWPADVIFPYRLADGRRAWWRRDQQGAVLETVKPRREIVGVLTGANRAHVTGAIPAWRGVGPGGEMLGLNPDAWYPVVPNAPPVKGLRVTALSDGVLLRRIAEGPKMAAVGLGALATVPYHFAEMMATAHCGWRGYGGGEEEVVGPLSDLDASGTIILPQDSSTIAVQPPWKLSPAKQPPDGLPANSGLAYARFSVTIPDKPSTLRTTVYLSQGATLPGRSDGVLFRIRVQAGDQELKAEKFVDSETPAPLDLVLTAVRGKRAQVWLEVEPNHNPNYDWARWGDPRIEVAGPEDADVTLADDRTWPVALAGGRMARPAGPQWSARLSLPGTAYLLQKAPEPVQPGVKLWKLPFLVSFSDETGLQLTSPQYAAAVDQPNTVAGVTREGIFAQPPNHGRTYAELPLRLPTTPVVFHAWVGLREGAKSDGCRFLVEVDGRVVCSRLLMPADGWQEATADLSGWAGKPVVLALVTDSAGTFDYDWGSWGEPTLQAKK